MVLTSRRAGLPGLTGSALTFRLGKMLSDVSPDEPGVGLPRSKRWAVYGISGEAYEAIHELDEFGLLTVHDTMPHRRHGKLRPLPAGQRAALDADGEFSAPMPYRLEIKPDTAFDRPTLTTVHRSLLDTPRDYPSDSRLGAASGADPAMLNGRFRQQKCSPCCTAEPDLRRRPRVACHPAGVRGHTANRDVPHASSVGRRPYGIGYRWGR